MPIWMPKDRLSWSGHALRNPRLTSTEKVLAMACEGFANRAGQLWPRKRTLSQQLNLSEKTVQRALKRLASHGYLRIKPRIGTTPIYQIKFPDADENDPGGSQRGNANSDNVVLLTSYEPEIEPTRCSSANPVNDFHPSQPSRVLEKIKLPEAISDFATRKDFGKYEVELANRLGPNGYDVLASLSWPKLMFLLRKSLNGTVSENDLAEARVTWLKRMKDPGGA